MTALKLPDNNACLPRAEASPAASYVSLREVTKSYGGGSPAVADLTLEVEKGEFFSLLGPSGCGKTTLLRLIAGLEAPERGTIRIGGDTVSGGAWAPPEKRGVGIVFQEYALFLHMTVAKNVAFGLRGCSAQERKERTRELLDMVGLSTLADRYPHELSGGQQQRVALARAIAPFPRVMLLDEPFSNLDADLRTELRMETRRILKDKGITTILVTHDQEEAFSLSDRVGVLNRGRLEQVGSPSEIYHRPTNRFVASFVGRADFVRGRLQGDTIATEAGVFRRNGAALPDGAEVELMIRPDDVDFTVDGAGAAVITEAQFLGAEVMYTLLLPNGRSIHSLKPSTTIHAPGGRVGITIDPAHIIVFPTDGDDNR